VAILVVLSTCACSSIVQHDAAPPVGLIATTTPWVGSFDSVDLPLTVNSVTSVSCPTTSSCWATGSTEGGGGNALGAVILATKNGGATWTSDVIPASIGYLSSISCRDATHCAAVGETTTAIGMEGAALVTSDGGRVWDGPPPIAGTTDITAVTCRPSGRCLAIGSGPSGGVAVTLQPDGTPQAAGLLPPGTSDATDISCADDEDCWVTGANTIGVDNIAGSVAYTTNFGTTWTGVPLPPGTGTLNGLTCSSAANSAGSLPFGSTSTTVAPGATTTEVPAPGASSAATSAPATTTTTTVVPTTTTTTLPGVPGFDCTVVGTTSTTVNATRSGHGLILTTANGGSSWTVERVPATAASFTDVSCPTAGSCATVGTSVATAPEAGLVVLTGTGSPWKHATTVAVPQPIAAVSCASLGHCVMAGEAVSERLDAS
jgi:hypothetical protein